MVALAKTATAANFTVRFTFFIPVDF